VPHDVTGPGDRDGNAAGPGLQKDLLRDPLGLAIADCQALASLQGIILGDLGLSIVDVVVRVKNRGRRDKVQRDQLVKGGQAQQFLGAIHVGGLQLLVRVNPVNLRLFDLVMSLSFSFAVLSNVEKTHRGSIVNDGLNNREFLEVHFTQAKPWFAKVPKDRHNPGLKGIIPDVVIKQVGLEPLRSLRRRVSPHKAENRGLGILFEEPLEQERAQKA